MQALRKHPKEVKSEEDMKKKLVSVEKKLQPDRFDILQVQVGSDYEVDGIQATRFVFEENALDNGHLDVRNKCFCRKGECLTRGLIDVTDCYYGFPIALSYPHFYDADPELLTTIEGLHPNGSIHGSFFMINAMSGLPLKLSVKFQINMAMGDITNMAECERFSNVVIPTLWFEITMVQLPKALRNRFLFYLYYLRIFDRIVYYALFIGGSLLLLFSVLRVSVSISAMFSTSHRISTVRKNHISSDINSQGNRRNSILKNNTSKLESGSEQEREQFLLR
ncbi:scavenger receptor class B member 1-like [Ochlerotatus camptorhynchus]|uniref:scavenger receptor class B member 1-like n=1 Tax=Ochlerotatus camptorhynchus TaxID=644619 RepID=UPI0031D60795